MTRTRVRVIGASTGALRELRTMAPAHLDIVNEPVAEPDWIVVATADQRLSLIHISEPTRH